MLDAELWIVVDDQAAVELEEELRTEGRPRPVLTAAEAMILGKMAQADAREIFAALAKVQAVMPGSRLRNVRKPEGDADA